MTRMLLSAILLLSLAPVARAVDPQPADGPSFDCTKVAADSIATLICRDPVLAALDRKLGATYAAAARQAAYEYPPQRLATLHGWSAGRDDCRNRADPPACVREVYEQRIVELQVRYRLVPATAPLRYACDGDPGHEIVVTGFQTDPPSLLAERDGRTALMRQQVVASGVRYQGPNESLWEHQGEARVRWGYGQPELICRAVP